MGLGRRAREILRRQGREEAGPGLGERDQLCRPGVANKLAGEDRAPSTAHSSPKGREQSPGGQSPGGQRPVRTRPADLWERIKKLKPTPKPTKHPF